MADECGGRLCDVVTDSGCVGHKYLWACVVMHASACMSVGTSAWNVAHA